jgi:hypothetical protein
VILAMLLVVSTQFVVIYEFDCLCCVADGSRVEHEEAFREVLEKRQAALRASEEAKRASLQYLRMLEERESRARGVTAKRG